MDKEIKAKENLHRFLAFKRIIVFPMVLGFSLEGKIHFCSSQP
jgi:hypothetical protein